MPCVYDPSNDKCPKCNPVRSPSMRGSDGTFDDFIRDLQVVMPAIKRLEAAGSSDDDIAQLFEFVAQWLRSREPK